MTALVSLLFITMIPIDCEITNFPYTFIYKSLINTYLYTIMVDKCMWLTKSKRLLCGIQIWRVLVNDMALIVFD